MVNLSIKWAAFFMADGILFILLGASRFLPTFHPGLIATGGPISPAILQSLSSSELNAVYNYYFYGALFVAFGFTILLVKYLRNHNLKPTIVLENPLD